jgi:hypothetical protein
MPDLRFDTVDDTRTLQQAAERLRQHAGGRAALLPTVLGGVELSLHDLSRDCHAAAGSLISCDDQAELSAALGEAGAALREAAESCGRARELMWVSMGAPD